MRLVSLGYVLILCSELLACAEHPSYVVCRGETYCTTPLSHEEALQAVQLKKAWADDALYIRPGR
jgi:hypothetical protein